jgi:Cu2+-containing amine oxidase
MEIKKIVHSILVISLSSFIFISCIGTDNSTGDGLIPDDYYMSLHRAEFDVPLQMKMSDSLQTNSSNYAAIGSINDSDFGMMQSASAFAFAPYIDSLSYGTNPIPKSLFLSIAGISYETYSDRDNYIHQSIFAHRLNNDLDSLKTIYNNSISAVDYNPTPLNIGGGNVFFGNNSNISINLSLDYARELLQASSDERSNRFKFIKRYKGLYLRADPVSNTYIGGRLFFIPMSSSAAFSTYMGLSLTYWHVDSEIPNGKDSTITYVSYALTNVNSVTHSSTPLESTSPAGPILLEGMAGIKPYIDFSEIKSSIDIWATANQIDLSKLIVAKAELQLYYDASGDYDFMNRTYPSMIFLNTREQNTNKNKLYIPVSDIMEYQPKTGQSTMITNLNRSKELYSINISSYVQHLIKGDLTEEEKKAWIMADNLSTDSNGQPVGYFVDNLSFNKVTFFGPNDVKKPKLIITYALTY